MLQEIQSPEATRKSAKGKGLDREAIRASKEEKGIQIRKEKRLDRANIERRKFKIEESEDDRAMVSSHARIRNLDILPKKCELLRSPDVAKQLDAAVYFRRILAADKFPPLDLVVETQLVIPTLISYLSRVDSLQLQIESAWCLTNIACGETRHIHCLVQHGAIRELVSTVSLSRSKALVDQCLWALCNISSDEWACQCMRETPHILVPLLKQVGLNCPPYSISNSSISISSSSSSSSPSAALSVSLASSSYPTQFDMPDFPSLSTMRHITFTLGNFSRLRFPLTVEEYRFILFTFADLIESPDEEIILDICNSLISLCTEQHSLCLPLLLRQGLLSRMVELLDLTSIGEIALLVICAIVRGTCIAAAAAAASVTVSVFSSVTIAAAAGGSVVNPLQWRVYRAAALCQAPGSSRSGKSTLQCIVDLLRRSDNNLTRKDILGMFVALFDSREGDAPRLLQQSVELGLVGVLGSLVDRGCSYDVKVEVGQCLCRILMSGLVLDAATSNQASVVLCDLLSLTDYQLLSVVISSLTTLFTSSLQRHIYMENYRTVAEKVDLLTIHPFSEIAQRALQTESVVTKYRRFVIGDIEEGDDENEDAL